MRKQYKKIVKRMILIFSAILLFLFSIIAYANWKIPEESAPYLYDSVDSIPNTRVALVLGTSPTMRGYSNPYFYNRIDAAKELYEAGKVKYFILSGDNSHLSYNEPKYMRQALTKAGVPDSIIFPDYAGFRTFDSVVRAKKVFQQDSIIVVSQKFHNERAIYIARHYGVEAYGYNAVDLVLSRASVKTKVREKLARVKVFIDIMIGTKPKFLGEPIDIKMPNNKNSENIDSIDSI